MEKLYGLLRKRLRAAFDRPDNIAGDFDRCYVRFLFDVHRSKLT